MLYFSVSANFWNFFKRISFSPSQNISMTDFCLIDTFLTFWTQSVSLRTLCENSKKIIINLLCQSSPYFVKSILEIPLQKANFFQNFIFPWSATCVGISTLCLLILSLSIKCCYSVESMRPTVLDTCEFY